MPKAKRVIPLSKIQFVNVPLPPAVYRYVKSEAATGGLKQNEYLQEAVKLILGSAKRDLPSDVSQWVASPPKSELWPE